MHLKFHILSKIDESRAIHSQNPNSIRKASIIESGGAGGGGGGWKNGTRPANRGASVAVDNDLHRRPGGS